MEWQIKIEGQSKQRILINFDPQGELILFTGQYSIKNKWIDFSTETHSMSIDLETIQELLLKVYEKMNKRLEVYEDLAKSFSVIKTIEIQKVESVPTAKIIDNSIFGSPIENRDRNNV
jgi:hypothetical protein